MASRVPILAIVGRPNVGKSTLFNAFVGVRVSIEDPTPGVTRDRVSAWHEHEGRTIELVDTGGIGIEDIPELALRVEAQIAVALEEASAILFVVDVRDGLTPLDRHVADLLRRRKQPILLVANKVDDRKFEPQAAEFHALGMGEPILVSARQKYGVRDLLTRAVALLPPAEADEKLGEIEITIAIVGKRNAGKSSLVNAIAGSERVIVSEVPGTTRDSIDVRFERDGRVFVAIDTAGLRREKSLANSIEFYGQARAERSIRRADVVLFLIDAAVPIGLVDKKIAHAIRDAEKPCALVVNKWDLARAKNLATGTYEEYLEKTLPGMGLAPIAFASAKTGKNVQGTLDLAETLFRQAGTRVSTPELNRALREALERHPPRTRKAVQPKIYYATQTGVRPPSILVFCNSPKAFSAGYRRFLEGFVGERFDIAEVPIRFNLKARPRGTGKDRAMTEPVYRPGRATRR
ncbi:MAG: ribosome biogenesis GTPase Der [Planctomycetes bacterium]|nr:ribosome biogenesis GTPase Der [Planctomycetota bacterium]